MCLVASAVFGCATTGGHRGRARLVGLLWWVTPADAALDAAAWAEELDYIQALGMDLMVLNGPFVGGEIGEPLDALFDEADRRGMRLFIDTLAAPDWWVMSDASAEVDRARRRVRDIERQYGHRRSFAGFYIPYELYVMWDGQRELIQTLYREISAACKETAPTRPVMISPFFILDSRGYLGDFRWATPEEYRDFWAETLKQASVDIVALQDSGEHLACYTIEERAPFFEAMKAACDAAGAQLWANIETGELNVTSLEDFVARFGLGTHVNDPSTQPFWRAVPPPKLDEKLRFARRYTPTAITWGYREFVRPSLGSTAAENYLGYLRVLR